VLAGILSPEKCSIILFKILSMLRLVLYALVTHLFVTCSNGQSYKKLTEIPPEKVGYSATFFPAFTKKLNDSMPSLGSFLVSVGGNIVYEHYFHGATKETAFNIKSITKSVVSAIAGIAKSQGKLPDLNTPVLTLFPEFSKPRSSSSDVWFANDKASEDSIRRTLRLRDLLTMQTGWEWNDFGPVVNVFINSADPVRFTMDIPFAESPGTRFTYCSAATSLFSAALAKCIKTDLKSFATTHLFEPVGMTLVRWDKDPVGRYVGASEMYMTSRSLLRFGMMYLNKGKVNGKQILSERWINESTGEQAVLNYWDILPNANGYGYYWWRRKINGQQACIASGAGGQIITVIPGLNMVIVANCLLNAQNRGREEIARIHAFVEEVVKAPK
jgi:CubicO group peptidase (beta-lactamase class C family)